MYSLSGFKSHVSLSAEEGGALTGVTVAGGRGHRQGGVGVVAQVRLSLAGHLTAGAAVQLVLKWVESVLGQDGQNFFTYHLIVWSLRLVDQRLDDWSL